MVLAVFLGNLVFLVVWKSLGKFGIYIVCGWFWLCVAVWVFSQSLGMFGIFEVCGWFTGFGVYVGGL